MKKPTTDMTVALSNDETGTHVQTHYGVRLPDGTHRWNAIEGAGLRVNLQGMLDPAETPTNRAIFRDSWGRYIASQAKDAHLDKDEYEAMHTFVKRTVVLAVTTPEVV